MTIYHISKAICARLFHPVYAAGPYTKLMSLMYPAIIQATQGDHDLEVDPVAFTVMLALVSLGSLELRFVVMGLDVCADRDVHSFQ